jgi:hypothetical protein
MCAQPAARGPGEDGERDRGFTNHIYRVMTGVGGSSEEWVKRSMHTAIMSID